MYTSLTDAPLEKSLKTKCHFVSRGTVAGSLDETTASVGMHSSMNRHQRQVEQLREQVAQLAREASVRYARKTT